VADSFGIPLLRAIGPLDRCTVIAVYDAVLYQILASGWTMRPSSGMEAMLPALLWICQGRTNRERIVESNLSSVSRQRVLRVDELPSGGESNYRKSDDQGKSFHVGHSLSAGHARRLTPLV
jgi:hypothetical protein